MIVKLLNEHHLEFLSLKGGCRGSFESTHDKMPHCWKSHALAHLSVLFWNDAFNMELLATLRAWQDLVYISISSNQLMFQVCLLLPGVYRGLATCMFINTEVQLTIKQAIYTETKAYGTDLKRLGQSRILHANHLKSMSGEKKLFQHTLYMPISLGQNFFYKLIYKPSYCNYPESRKKKKILKLLFYFIHRL